MLLLNQLFHVPEEEREQQRADMGSIHIRVCHDDDFVIPELRRIEIVFANTGAHGGNQRPNFLMAQHSVVACFFDVEDLTLKRQNRLETAVPSLLGRPAG